MAELRKDEPAVRSAFLFPAYSQEDVMKWDFQKIPIIGARGRSCLFRAFFTVSYKSFYLEKRLAKGGQDNREDDRIMLYDHK